MIDHGSETPPDERSPLYKTILRVQAEVREEFDAWNAKHVQEVLLGDVRRPLPEPASSRNVEIEDMLGLHVSTRFSSRGEVLRPPWLAPSAPVNVHYDTSDWEFEPTPEYEYCAPSNRNCYVGDDSSALLFDPLSDKTRPKEHEEFLDMHDDFAWTTLADPADEFIVLETAVRLQEMHDGLSLQDIHEEKVLSPPLFDHKTICGIFSHGKNRDYPEWNRPSPVRIFDRPENQSTSTSIPRCPHRGCVASFPCTLHDPKSSRKIVAQSSKPVLDLHTLRQQNEPCGDNCGLAQGVKWNVQEPWPESDEEVLRDALMQQPALLPCLYAAMWGVPCNEVFTLREKILPQVYPDLDEQPSRPTTKRRNKKKKPVTELRNAPHAPCSHDGPCTSNVCACYKASGFCERDCRCSEACDRRWRGCTCAKGSGAACVRRTCRCVAANRECDPDACGQCGASDAEEQSCGNVSLQRRSWKKLEVRQATWGYGAFLLEPAKKGELVIEYVGEIIAQPTVDSREYVARERERHYLYNLNNVFTLDASYASNVARYINHNSKQVNCQARVRLVGGEQRIAIVADRNLEVGEELFLNYGKEFPIPGESPE
ncbi:unnamed protein product [Peniophora sp. CBMAI 1063]|nr:unnamed protein product [Peniophora sp. CBMAI 1063]